MEFQSLSPVDYRLLLPSESYTNSGPLSITELMGLIMGVGLGATAVI